MAEIDGGGKRVRQETVPTDLRRMSAKAERLVNTIQRDLRRRQQVEQARGELTGPQRLVMQEVMAGDGRGNGLSVREVAERVSLAHSTVSGIVARLVTKGLIERRQHETDMRVTVLAARAAKEPVEQGGNPLLEALRYGSVCERKIVMSGLDVLARLMRVAEGEP